MSKYSNEFKLNVINDRNNGLSLHCVADKYNINITQVHTWTKNYNEVGEESFIDKRSTSPLKGRPRTKFDSIEEELEYVKIQNEYLKKRMAKQLNMDVEELGLPSYETIKRR